MSVIIETSYNESFFLKVSKQELPIVGLGEILEKMKIGTWNSGSDVFLVCSLVPAQLNLKLRLNKDSENILFKFVQIQ